jgi:hypothetical protein
MKSILFLIAILLSATPLAAQTDFYLDGPFKRPAKIPDGLVRLLQDEIKSACPRETVNQTTDVRSLFSASRITINNHRPAFIVKSSHQCLTEQLVLDLSRNCARLPIGAEQRHHIVGCSSNENSWLARHRNQCGHSSNELHDYLQIQWFNLQGARMYGSSNERAESKTTPCPMSTLDFVNAVEQIGYESRSQVQRSPVPPES